VPEDNDFTTVMARRTFFVKRYPDRCPLCSHGIEPKGHGFHWIGRPPDEPYHLEHVFQCPRADCGRLFIARYAPDWSKFAGGNHPQNRAQANPVELKPIALLPRIPAPPTVPSELRELSPMFAAVVIQASAAEDYGLLDVAGMGFRKALEFLVKDFCISKRPDAADAIKATMLGPCISTYIEDANIKACAARATWLGNDESHYERRWVDKDLSDLKALLALTMGWVRSHILTAKYLAEMPPK
jgi:hypothetical protein